MCCFLVKAKYVRESLMNRSGCPDLSTGQVRKAFIAMQLTFHFVNQKIINYSTRFKTFSFTRSLYSFFLEN